MSAPTSRPLTAITRNVTPHTPATTASLTVTRLVTWLTPSDPHVKPPRGHIPRTQSMTVHRDAQAAAVTNGRPSRRTAGAASPNRPAVTADTKVSATHAMEPNRAIQ